MAYLEVNTVLRVSRRNVCDLVSDPTRYIEWIHFVREVYDISDVPLKEGNVYHERAKPGPVETVSR